MTGAIETRNDMDVNLFVIDNIENNNFNNCWLKPTYPIISFIIFSLLSLLLEMLSE